MSTFGNPNTLRHAPAGWGRPRAAAPAADPVLESRLRHEQRWPELTVQLFDEPAHLAPVHLAPPRHLRLLLLHSGTLRIHLARTGMTKLTTPHHPAYELHWTALTAAPVRTGHLYLPPMLLVRTAEAIRLDELAALAHLSAYHFCRVFKRTTGLTPAQFVTQQRLGRATELLRAGGLSVKQVAAAVGYTSHAHFTKLFARHLGRLPRDSR